MNSQNQNINEKEKNKRQVIPQDSINVAFIDLEATCWKKELNIDQRTESETIEIGLVIKQISPENKILHKQSLYIRPQKHKILSEFCTNLTGITQNTVNEAPLYTVQLDKVSKLFEEFNVVKWFSWGTFDKNQLVRDAKYHEISLPYWVTNMHTNLKSIMSRCEALGGKRTKGIGLANALLFYQLEFLGSPHSGVDDAFNMSRLYTTIANRYLLRRLQKNNI